MYSLDGLTGSFGAFGLGADLSTPATLELAAQPDLDSDRFQSLWMQLPETAPFNRPLKQGI